MPSRPITVKLNANQSKKFVHLLDIYDDCPRQSILRDARNKFRIRALSIVFLQGGEELADDITLNSRTNTVWIGKGEPYVGRARDSPPPSADVELPRIIAHHSIVDEAAQSQLRAVSQLPHVRRTIGLPDLHPGNRFPVGCAVVADGIYPALVGSDIGCGVALYELAPSRALRQNSEKLASRLRGLDGPLDGDIRAWLSASGVHEESDFDVSSLGTVGAGNHFAEICVIDEVVHQEAANTVGLREDALYLLVHTGSRGLGGSILGRQTQENANPYLNMGSPELQQYLTEHDHAIRWAIANRDLVAHRISQCLYPSDSDANPPPGDLRKLLDLTHNSVTRSVSESGESVWIHRKGAAPTDGSSYLIPCPGSRGDFSWLLLPTGSGAHNAHSLAHGAGRRLARNALHGNSKKSALAALRETSLGSFVVCEDNQLLVEEQPRAYKDVSHVVEDLEEAGLCVRAVRLRPLVSYKVREGCHGK